MTRAILNRWILCAITLASCTLRAQSHVPPGSSAELHLRIVSSISGTSHAAPAVIWLEPAQGTPALPFLPHGSYTLLQKNRTFAPHLLVIPVGSQVQFPNEDPFFHNVFSLFDGKRFNLGLYEAGSSKSVSFSREGVSYIFCNIHPEMSAVVIALSTPLYTIADANDAFLLRNIPFGDYRLHVWIEGVPALYLEGLDRTVHLSTRTVDLGEWEAPLARAKAPSHDNLYGKPYPSDTHTVY